MKVPNETEQQMCLCVQQDIRVQMGELNTTQKFNVELVSKF